MAFLYLLEKIRIPGLNEFMLAITTFGEETAFLVIALVLFWCVDKYVGYYTLSGMTPVLAYKITVPETAKYRIIANVKTSHPQWASLYVDDERIAHSLGDFPENAGGARDSGSVPHPAGRDFPNPDHRSDDRPIG